MKMQWFYVSELQNGIEIEGISHTLYARIQFLRRWPFVRVRSIVIGRFVWLNGPQYDRMPMDQIFKMEAFNG